MDGSTGLQRLGARVASEVREPTVAELERIVDIADAFAWAKIKGDLTMPGTRAGSLLRLVAQDEWPECEIADFASVSPAAFDALLVDWYYCKDGTPDTPTGSELDDEHYDSQFSDQTPGPMLIGHAQALHHACRIKAKIVHTREAQDQYDHYRLEAMQQSSSSAGNAPIIIQNPTPPLIEKVSISQLLDPTKNSEVPLVARDVFNQGLANWKRIAGHGLDDPVPAIRPSIEQYSAWLSLVALGCTYVDFCVCAPWDIRTARSRKWKGLVMGADGKMHESECKGPPDFACWTLCFRLWECMCIMSGVLLPPRITAYFDMAKGMLDKHGHECYPYWYQQEDRYRHEQLPDFHRLIDIEYDDAVIEYRATGWWEAVKFRKSIYSPDAPWNHVYHYAVRSEDSSRWWTDNYLWKASQVVLRIITLESLIENDAPIAASVKDHALTAYVPPGHAKAPWREQPRVPKRPAVEVAHTVERRTMDASGKYKICRAFNPGQCSETADGPCGPNSCKKKPHFIHACNVCGEVGHGYKDCTVRPHVPRGKGKKGGEARGKGKKGGRG